MNDYECPACGSRETRRGPWRDYSGPVTMDLSVPTCVEFMCGTRKLIDVDDGIIAMDEETRRLSRRPYFDQSEECKSTQRWKEMVLMKDVCTVLCHNHTTTKHRKKIKEALLGIMDDE